MPYQRHHRDHHRQSDEDEFRRRVGVVGVVVGGLAVGLAMFGAISGFGPSRPGPVTGTPPVLASDPDREAKLPEAVREVRAIVTAAGRAHGLDNAAACVEADRHLALSHDGPLAVRSALPVSVRHLLGQADRRCPAVQRQLVLELLACAAEEGVLPLSDADPAAPLAFDGEALLVEAGCPPLGGVL
ncbi:MAG: hypothetical protein H6733_17055 [Alphaproteobacteria bacterium]|nr:hypothetical protein [Alphaproteobacteria bacterium]